jgi:Chaperone of endosialidase
VNKPFTIFCIFIFLKIYSMKKIIFVFATAFFYINVFAQNVGIGTATPHQSAKLDVSAADKGMLVPRVKLRNSTDILTIPGPAKSLLVFNLKDSADVKPGYYYWNDSVWTGFISESNFSSNESSDWRVKGNVVQPAVQFMGSTNLASVPFRLNNIHSGLLGLTNTSFGFQTMQLGVVGTGNVAIGKNTLQSLSVSNKNVAVGDEVLKNFDDDGTGENTGVGHSALLNTDGNSAAFNTAVGSKALSANIGGFDNTALGNDANTTVGNLSNTTVIGSQSRVSSINTMAFGNGAVEKWVFGRQTSPANQAFKVGTGAGNGNGAYLTDGGAWTNTSDKNLKDDIVIVQEEDLLQKVMSMPLSRWKYKGTNEYHIGPMAQDFYTAFQVGLDDESISTIDPAGVALACIQALKKENDDLKNKLDLLLQRLDKLEHK